MFATYTQRLFLGTICIFLLQGWFAGEKVNAVVNPQSGQSTSDWWYKDDVIIVNFKVEAEKSGFNLGKSSPRTGISMVDALFGKYRVKNLEKLFIGAETPKSAKDVDLSNYYRITFAAKDSLEKAVQDFGAVPDIEHVERIGVHPVMALPNDPSFSSQWGLNQGNDQDIDAPEAWNSASGDSAILVGTMDTGVQWDHPDLGGASPYTNGNIWINWAEYNGVPGDDDDGNGYVDDIRGWDFVDNVSGWPGEDSNTPDNNPMDFNGHGTHVSGIMAAITNNGVGVSGVAGGFSPSQRGCRIVPLRIGWSQNTGGQELGYVSMDFAAQALFYASQKHVTSVNCSWGSSNSGGIAAAVTNAVNNGMVIVSAAGNDNNQTASYLCSRTDVLAVASVTSSGVKSSFSSYGTWVDVSAPGSNIYSTYSFHGSAGYASLSGTSMAAPHVTGLAGLLRSRLPSLTKNALDSIIVTSTDNIDALNPSYLGKLGTGRINANISVGKVFAGQVISNLRFGPVPLDVGLNGFSAGQVDTWKWAFGDGDTASGQSVNHEYVNPGRYDVSLTISGPEGTSTTTLASYVIAYADTLKMQQFAGTRTDSLVYEFRLKNYAPITTLTLPITYSGNMDISLDSLSRVGTRSTAFEYFQLISSSSSSHLFTLKMIANNGGGSPPLTAGDGVLFKAYFKYDVAPPNPGLNTIDTTRYSTYAYDIGSSFGAYPLVIAPGTISIHGPRGDADQSGTIDISDVVFLIAYIFGGGPQPPLFYGDADASNVIDISDVVYLIAFIFGGGPQPPPLQ